MKKILAFLLAIMYCVTTTGYNDYKNQFPTTQALFTYIRAELAAIDAGEISNLQREAKQLNADLQHEKRCKKLLSKKRPTLKNKKIHNNHKHD